MRVIITRNMKIWSRYVLFARSFYYLRGISPKFTSFAPRGVDPGYLDLFGPFRRRGQIRYPAYIYRRSGPFPPVTEILPGWTDVTRHREHGDAVYGGA